MLAWALVLSGVAWGDEPRRELCAYDGAGPVTLDGVPCTRLLPHRPAPSEMRALCAYPREGFISRLPSCAELRGHVVKVTAGDSGTVHASTRYLDGNAERRQPLAPEAPDKGGLRVLATMRTTTTLYALLSDSPCDHDRSNAHWSRWRIDLPECPLTGNPSRVFDAFREAQSMGATISTWCAWHDVDKDCPYWDVVGVRIDTPESNAPDEGDDSAGDDS